MHDLALTVSAAARLSECAVPPLEAEIAGFAGAVSCSTGRMIRGRVRVGKVDGLRCECWRVGERVGVQLGDELDERWLKRRRLFSRRCLANLISTLHPVVAVVDRIDEA